MRWLRDWQWDWMPWSIIWDSMVDRVKMVYIGEWMVPRLCMIIYVLKYYIRICWMRAITCGKCCLFPVMMGRYFRWIPSWNLSRITGNWLTRRLFGMRKCWPNCFKRRRYVRIISFCKRWKRRWRVSRISRQTGRLKWLNPLFVICGKHWTKSLSFRLSYTWVRNGQSWNGREHWVFVTVSRSSRQM